MSGPNPRTGVIVTEATVIEGVEEEIEAVIGAVTEVVTEAVTEVVTEVVGELNAMSVVRGDTLLEIVGIEEARLGIRIEIEAATVRGQEVVTAKDVALAVTPAVAHAATLVDPLAVAPNPNTPVNVTPVLQPTVPAAHPSTQSEAVPPNPLPNHASKVVLPNDVLPVHPPTERLVVHLPKIIMDTLVQLHHVMVVIMVVVITVVVLKMGKLMVMDTGQVPRLPIGGLADLKATIRNGLMDILMDTVMVVVVLKRIMVAIMNNDLFGLVQYV